MTRILVVDDVKQWRTQIRNCLEMRSDLQVVGEAASGRAALENAAELRPDLVLLDIGLPDLSGVSVAEQIREAAPGTKILFVTLMNDAESARKLVNDGAQGYLLKSNLASELLVAVDTVNAGGRFISQQFEY